MSRKRTDPVSGGTYVYCLVHAARRPSLARVPAGVPGSAPVRALEIDRSLWAIASTVPAADYSEHAIERGLKDLTWVSACAVGHERVVEAFLGRGTLVPMKLFTIFTSDDRAKDHIARERRSIDRLVRRLKDRVELGVRMSLVAPAPRGTGDRAATTSGAGYLRAKKAMHDASLELGARAQARVDDVFAALASASVESLRRPVLETSGGGGRVLLDAAHLVASKNTRRFQARVRQLAKQLANEGYAIVMTGPWPAYNFIGDRA